jgi:hypothetical protein
VPPIGKSNVLPSEAVDFVRAHSRIAQPSCTFGGNVIWNSSWAAADRQTLMGWGITGVVTGAPYNYPENPIHDPWPDRFPEPSPGPF